MLERGGAQPRSTARGLAYAIWNINGLKNKREYIQDIITQHDLDLLFLSETKIHSTVDMSLYLAIDVQTYRVVQLASNEHHRGGLILIIRRTIRLETVGLLRPKDNVDCYQGIIMEDREGRALAFWYGAPTLGNTELEGIITRLLKDYDTQFLAGDFNSRHPAW